MGSVKFRYGLDPLCLMACAMYLICRFLIKPHFTTGFWHNHAIDVLLVPAALPFLLWVQRKLRLRLNDEFPTWSEIGLHLALWSILFEGFGPMLMSVTRDWLDIAAYTVGALFAGLWWQWLSPKFGT